MTRGPVWPFWILLAIAAIAIPASAQLFNLARFGTTRAFEAVFDNAGNPWPFTNLVPAINYDQGGQGIGFGAVARTDQPGCQLNASTYRADYFNFQTSPWTAQPSVPYDICGSLTAGDFHNYTTSVTSAGPFNMTLYTANAIAGAVWTVNIDNSPVATVTLPGSGGFTTIQATTSTNFNVSQGTHILKIVGTAGDPTNHYIGDFAGWQGAVAGATGGSGNVLLGTYQANNTSHYCVVTTRCPDYIIDSTFFGPSGGSNPCSIGFGLDGYPLIPDFAPTDSTDSDMNAAGNGSYNSIYDSAVSNFLAPCASRIYAVRVASEWYNCNQNTYSVFVNPGCESGPLPFTAQTFINAVRNVVAAIRRNSATAGLKIEFDAPKDAFQQQYWPGNDVVDVSGIDYYFQLGVNGLPSDPNQAWTAALGDANTPGTLTYVYNYAQSQGKPFMFAESCIGPAPGGSSDAQGATFMNLFWPWAQTHLVAWTNWNSLDAVTNRCIVDAGSQKAAAFASQINNTTYTGSFWQPYKVNSISPNPYQ